MNVPLHLTTVVLELEVLKGEDASMPGPYRRAKHLLTVPPEARVEVSLHAGYLVNTDQWRPSDAVAHAAKRWLAGYRHTA